MISPRGFSALVADAQSAIAGLNNQLGDDVMNATVNDGANVTPLLDQVDGDAWLLDQQAATELDAARTTPTQYVVQQLPQGDAAHFAGDSAVSPVNAVNV